MTKNPKWFEQRALERMRAATDQPTLLAILNELYETRLQRYHEALRREARKSALRVSPGISGTFMDEVFDHIERQRVRTLDRRRRLAGKILARAGEDGTDREAVRALLGATSASPRAKKTKG